MIPFTVINEPFTCENCGHKNPKLKGSCRNHCQKCLYSMHLDVFNPGDRLSKCKALMKPFGVTQKQKIGWTIYHKCTKCNHWIPNKAAPDDNFDLIIELSTKPFEIPRSKKN
ncbi:RNHCP domain-containing protein [Patescibacteria group bacterium]